MRVMRYGQSCLLIETKGKRILIDPGVLLFEESILESDWKNIDLILVTHKHSDHCNLDAIKIMTKRGAKLYTTNEVAEAFPELFATMIKESDLFYFDEIKIEVTRAVHGYIPLLKGGKEIFENVGYIIDDGENRIYQAGDSIAFPNDYKCDIVAVPICNHGLVMGPFEAGLFAKETGAKLVIPIHYDNPKYLVDKKKAKEEFKKLNLNFKFLDFGKSLDI